MLADVSPRYVSYDANVCPRRDGSKVSALTSLSLQECDVEVDGKEVEGTEVDTDGGPRAGGDITPETPDEVMYWWNRIAKEFGLQEIKTMTQGRRDMIRARVKDMGGKIDWVDVDAGIREQPFLRGENDQGWKLTFDSLFKRKLILPHILERFYLHNNGPRPQPDVKDQPLLDRAGIPKPMNLIVTVEEVERVKAGEATWEDITLAQAEGGAPW